MKINFINNFLMASTATTFFFSSICFSAVNAAEKNGASSQLLNESRFSPEMHSDSGRCDILNINGFKDQKFPCKLQLESGRGWVIFVQPPGSEDYAYHEGSYLTFNGYSEECGFGIGCPFRLEEGKLSTALQKVSSPNRTPSDFYIRKWNKFELKLVFDNGINKSAFTFRAK